MDNSSETLFEEYKLFVDHIHILTERRQTVTTTYLSFNAALVSAVTFLFLNLALAEWGKQLLTLGLLIAGFLACDFWRRLIRQYSQLINWWYGKLRLLESQIPSCQKLITAEYEDIYQAPANRGFGVMRYEIRLSWLFTMIYGSFCLILLVILGNSLVR